MQCGIFAGSRDVYTVVKEWWALNDMMCSRCARGSSRPLLDNFLWCGTTHMVVRISVRKGHPSHV